MRMQTSPLVAGRTVIPDEPALAFPTIAQIVEAVSERYGVSVVDLHSQRRRAPIARARSIAMWLCCRLTKHSTTTIGRVIGGRDITTVRDAFERIEELRRTDRDLQAGLAALEIVIVRKVDGV